jgi:hypothetical protein
MEDYAGAAAARHKDISALVAAQRTIFALHTGGVAIECQMKALLTFYHQITEWNEPGQRKKDPRCGQPIPNPGHGLLAALRAMDALHQRAKTDRLFLQHLDKVMHPFGPTEENFIEIRYYADIEAVNTMRD